MAYKDMSFEQWSKEVASIVEKHTGVSMDDLIDSDLQQAYDDGWSTWEGAVACLEDQDQMGDKEKLIGQVQDDPDFVETE